jgi:hypothetical protein
MLIKTTVLCDVGPCSLLEVYRVDRKEPHIGFALSNDTFYAVFAYTVSVSIIEQTSDKLIPIQGNLPST